MVLGKRGRVMIRAKKAAEILFFCRGPNIFRKEQLKSLPTDVEPVSLEEGYQVSELLAELINQPVSGYKVGATNAAIQVQNNSFITIYHKLNKKH